MRIHSSGTFLSRQAFGVKTQFRLLRVVVKFALTDVLPSQRERGT